jgi:hypothetical protein
MLELMGGILVGVFVGSAAGEVLRGQKPDLTNKVETTARTTVDSFFSALELGKNIFLFGFTETSSTRK